MKLSPEAQKALCCHILNNHNWAFKRVGQVFLSDEILKEATNKLHYIGTGTCLYVRFDEMLNVFSHCDSIKRYLYSELHRLHPNEYRARYNKPEFRQDVLRIFPPEKRENSKYFPVIAEYNNRGLMRITTSPFKALYEPYEVLTSMSHTGPILDIHVNFIGPGADSGGLSRQLFSQLSEGLMTAEHESIKFEIQDDGKFLPFLHGSDEKDVNLLRKLGALMALVAHSGGTFVFGDLFSDRFFNLLTKMHAPELEMETFSTPRLLQLYSEIMDDHELKGRFRLYLFMQSVTKVEDLTQEHHAFLQAFEIETTNKTMAEINEELNRVYTGMMQEKLRAIQIIASGLLFSLPLTINGHLCHNWHKLTALGAKVIKNAIQSSLTKERLKDLIKIRIIDSIPEVEAGLPLDQLSSPILTKELLKEWLYEWIDNHEMDHIRNWLQDLTSATNLVSPITFEINDAKDIYPHTCPMVISVPRRIIKETFMVRMDAIGTRAIVGDFTRS